MTSHQPLVSIVMCCYNGKKYLKETIDSILAQTYSNFEFIIWDDGSTDGSREIVESFKDDRIRYFFHENTGLGQALRMACEQARGDYLARMDADDISLPERIATEVKFMESHKDYVLVSSAVRYIDEDGNELGRTFPCTNDIVLKRSLLRTNMLVHPMVMMRKKAYQEAGGYIPVKVFEDRIFWSRLAKLGKFANIPKVLGLYRLLNTSISHSYNPYSPILYEFRSKMIKDDSISDDDIMLYNNIYSISKRQIQPGIKVNQHSRNNLEGFLFKILGGGHFGEKLICSFKNCFFIIKFKWLSSN